MKICQARYLMGTVVEVTVFTKCGRSKTQKVLDLAFGKFERLERLFNFFAPESELSRVNRDASRFPVPVSAEFFEVVHRGIEYSRLAPNCFSIALAPLSELWRRCARENRLPSRMELKQTREAADWRLVMLDSKQCAISFLHPNVKLDFDGFVKGYAVDRAREALQKNGVECAYIDVGQSGVCAFGAPPVEGRAWTVGMRHPSDERRVVGFFALCDGAVSSSGTNERRFDIAGKPFSHLIDPRSGRATTKIASATALSPSTECAEVASKAFFFSDAKRALLSVMKTDRASKALRLKVMAQPFS